MESLFNFVAPPTPCGYLHNKMWSLQYEVVGALTPAEYLERMRQGWRRFGDTLFRPRCSGCRACRSLRILVDRFHPDRSQRRVSRQNMDTVQLRIGVPSISQAKLHLYDEYHAFRAATRGWPAHEPKDPYNYRQSFVDNPFATEEWCYFVGRKLVAVGYVDNLPGGMSAIYFFYDPAERDRSLGTWNILCMVEQAVRRRIPHLYLGYYVADCPSMIYKARFRPNQVLGVDGKWHDFQS
jgi:leucyl-tRNA---protein transferase